MTGGYWHRFGPGTRRAFRCEAKVGIGVRRCRRSATWGWRETPRSADEEGRSQSQVVFCTQHARQEGAPR